MDLPLTLSDIEVLDGRELSSSELLGCMHYPLQCLAVGCQAVAITSGESASQDAINGTVVYIFEDLRSYAKPFQPPEGEEALS